MSLAQDVASTLEVWSAPDEEQERLRRLYLEHLATHPDGVLRSCRPDHVTASALVMTANTERVLLVRHRKVGLWLQTGGHCEADDPTLVAAAAREAQEETGIAALQVDPVPLRLSRHAVPFCSPGGHHLDVQLLAVAPSDAEPVVADGEDPVAWFGTDDPVDPTDPDTLALIAAARTRLRGTPRP